MSLESAIDTEPLEQETEEIVKTSEELFRDMLKSTFTLQDIAKSLMYLDENYQGSDKTTILAEGFAEFMHKREFKHAVDYFSMLIPDEKEYILNTRKYNYTLNDMEFRRTYRLDASEESKRKEFKKQGNL